MNKWSPFLWLCVFFAPSICAGSFLTAQQFPKTFEDLSFTERVAIIKEGFEPYESEYDSNGRCIKNCAYVGFTLKEEEERSKYATQQALADSALYESQRLSVDANNIVSAVGGGMLNQQFANCTSRNQNIQMGQGVPRGEPVIGSPRISSSYNLYRMHPVKNKVVPHYGIDYAVAIGTLVYTPADGLVVNVWHETGGCGYGVKIQHKDGNYTLYCHLSDSLVRIGDTVYAGCAIARSGNSGASTGPHLHYGIIDKKGGYIDPSVYTGRGS